MCGTRTNHARSSAGKIAGNAEAAPAQDAAALEKRASATVDKVTAERRKDMVPLAPDEWIKRIRRLIAERFPQYRRRLQRRLKTLNQVSREQVGLLRQFRAGGDDEVRNALLLTINCAAAGFGATG